MKTLKSFAPGLANEEFNSGTADCFASLFSDLKRAAGKLVPEKLVPA